MSPIAVLIPLLGMILVMGTTLFIAAGRWNIPAFWVYLLLFAVGMSATSLAAGPELMRERMKPAPGGTDYLTRILASLVMLSHLVIAGLDVGRFHWSVAVPLSLRIVAFFALSGCLIMWAIAMHTNRFFSSVIRIQQERGHYVIDTGPYRVVRHPGYAGILTLPLWSGVALGSWWSLVPAIFTSLIFIRRTYLEDRMLQAHLKGYREYAERVQYRLVPGLW